MSHGVTRLRISKVEGDMAALPFRLGLVVDRMDLGRRPRVAQSSLPQSLQPVKDRVPAGDVVYITDTKGVTIKGRLGAVTGMKCD